MELVKALLVVLTAVSVVLPIVGLVGLYLEARRLVDGMSGGKSDRPPGEWPVSGFVNAGLGAVALSPRKAKRDIFFIGAGIVAGGTAGIWSLFI